MLCFLGSLGKLSCRHGLSDKLKVKQLKKSTHFETQIPLSLSIIVLPILCKMSFVFLASTILLSVLLEKLY